MAKYRQALPAEFQQLLGLIRHGKLFALQEWIKDKKSLRVADVNDRRTAVLEIAIETGFHSVVEELLRAGGWSNEELVSALSHDLYTRRNDLAQLVIEHGANLRELDFEDVCQGMDVQLMERFLREGG